jgi:hypothetical protein
MVPSSVFKDFFGACRSFSFFFEGLCPVRLHVTPQPEGHTREGVDEWPSGGIPLHGRYRDPALKDAMAVRPWSFTKTRLLQILCNF